MPDWTFEPAVLLLVLAGAALKQVISCTLLPPPVPAENPKRKLEGSGPLDAVMFIPLNTVKGEPPPIEYVNVSRPVCVISSE